MRIEIAKNAGYCFGVRDAVELAVKSAEKHGTVYMLGDIVHNEVVVKRLAAKGVRVVSTLEEAKDAPLLFRAHGTAVEVWDAANESGLEVLDGTCPLVSKIHAEVRELAEDNDVVVIVGSFTSANTKRLCAIGEALNPRTYQVGGADDLDPAWFLECASVGVSAGASTPDDLIDEVVQKIRELGAQGTEKNAVGAASPE